MQWIKAKWNDFSNSLESESLNKNELTNILPDNIVTNLKSLKKIGSVFENQYDILYSGEFAACGGAFGTVTTHTYKTKFLFSVKTVKLENYENILLKADLYNEVSLQMGIRFNFRFDLVHL